MKGIITGILLSAMFCTFGYAQTGINSREQAEQLLRKGKTQQVAGIIVSGVGLTGLILGVNSFKPPDLTTLIDNVKATFLTAAAIAVSIIGIVYITTGQKKIKKANLFFNSEHLGITPEFKSRECLVSVGVRFNF